MTEAEIQKSIIDYAKTIGCIVIRMNSGSSGRSNIKLCPPGTPDLLLIHYSGALWVEVKNAKGKLRDTQVDMINRLEKLGQRVIVARTLSDVERELT